MYMNTKLHFLGASLMERNANNSSPVALNHPQASSLSQLNLFLATNKHLE
jgi:hypothetical protein